MNKFFRTTLKLAVGATAFSFAAGAALYEGAMNAQLSRKFTEKMGNTQAIPSDSNGDATPANYLDMCREGDEWFDKMNPPDVSLPDANGNIVHGYVIRQSEQSDKWALCSHGYSSEPRAEAYFGKHFYEKGFNVVLLSLAAYGNDTRKYCTMGYRDKDVVVAWINALVNKYPECKILLHGVSMGGATTLLTTGEELPDNVKCAVSDCAFTNTWEECAHVMKSMIKLPPFPLLSVANMVSMAKGNGDMRKISPVEAVSRSKTPTLFIHGTADVFVPYSMVDRLFDACTAEKERLDVPDAIHASAAAYAPDLYKRAMDDFAERYM